MRVVLCHMGHLLAKGPASRGIKLRSAETLRNSVMKGGLGVSSPESCPYPLMTPLDLIPIVLEKLQNSNSNCLFLPLTEEPLLPSASTEFLPCTRLKALLYVITKLFSSFYYFKNFSVVLAPT